MIPERVMRLCIDGRILTSCANLAFSICKKTMKGDELMWAMWQVTFLDSTTTDARILRFT